MLDLIYLYSSLSQQLAVVQLIFHLIILLFLLLPCLYYPYLLMYDFKDSDTYIYLPLRFLLAQKIYLYFREGALYPKQLICVLTHLILHIPFPDDKFSNQIHGIWILKLSRLTCFIKYQAYQIQYHILHFLHLCPTLNNSFLNQIF